MRKSHPRRQLTSEESNGGNPVEEAETTSEENNGEKPPEEAATSEESNGEILPRRRKLPLKKAMRKSHPRSESYL